ncbi:MAG: bifunctional nuclease family protein [Chthoniobacterales bacterium]|nr:bifunctional nuclease family protein [Chthoniobacterales bacterium]
MKQDVIQVSVQAVLPTPQGSAVFLGNEEKSFIIYVDNFVGQAISMALNGEKKNRPLTHDLIGMIFHAFNIKVERIIVNDIQNETYYARLILSAENEIQELKLVELDARPSDCIALASQQGAPIYVSRKVWDCVQDMSEILSKITENKPESPQSQQQLPTEEEPEEQNEDIEEDENPSDEDEQN